jgi:hypothetical protein
MGSECDPSSPAAEAPQRHAEQGQAGSCLRPRPCALGHHQRVPAFGCVSSNFFILCPLAARNSAAIAPSRADTSINGGPRRHGRDDAMANAETSPTLRAGRRAFVDSQPRAAHADPARTNLVSSQRALHFEFRGRDSDFRACQLRLYRVRRAWFTPAVFERPDSISCAVLRALDTQSIGDSPAPVRRRFGGC